MAYEDETLQQARESGVLDSEMDALALGLDDDEKERMSKKLQAQRSEEEQAKVEAKVREKKERRKDIERRDKGQSILERLIAFFKNLFSGVSKENLAKRKALKDSEDILGNFSIPVYDNKLGVVRGSFIESIYLLEKKLNNFSTFFNANFIISSKDLIEDRFPSFARFVIEDSLSMNQVKMLRQLKEIDLQHEFKMKGEKDTQKDLDVQIKKFAESFDKVNTSRIEDQLSIFLGLLNLKNYNFRALFTPFLREGTSMDEPDFTDFSLDSVRGFILNLDSYISGIPFKRCKEEHYKLFERFEEEVLAKHGGPGNVKMKSNMDTGDDDASGKLPRYTVEDFKGLLVPLRKMAEKDVLGHLVRIANEDPLYHSKPIINTISYAEKYKNLVISCIQEHVNNGIRELRQIEVQQEVDELFEGYTAFKEFPAVNNEISEKLKQSGQHGMEQQFTFTLVYNFTEKVYMERFRKSVNAIVVEGDFRTKEIANEFSNTYYGMDEAFEQAKDTALKLSEGSPIHVKIRNFLEGKIENPIAVKKLDEDLVALDEEMKKHAEEMNNYLMRMRDMMDAVVRDFKGLRAIDLLNAKSIGGVSNRSIMYSYDKFLIQLDKYKEIIGNFMVTHQPL